MGNFSDVFKAVFATTKTTATHLPVVTSAGAPDGIISTSDLASVLGAYTFGISSTAITDSTTDMAQITPGSYNLTNAVLQGLANKPSNFSSSSRIRLLVFAHAGDQYKTYFMFSNDTNSNILVGRSPGGHNITWQAITLT